MIRSVQSESQFLQNLETLSIGCHLVDPSTVENGHQYDLPSEKRFHTQRPPLLLCCATTAFDCVSVSVPSLPTAGTTSTSHCLHRGTALARRAMPRVILPVFRYCKSQSPLRCPVIGRPAQRLPALPQHLL